jgi:lipopolysaccharide export system protein LptA
MTAPAHFAVLVVLALAVGSAAAQPMSGPPNALQGFSVNRDKPVHITSATLEVRDKEKKATFLGNVLVAQGDTTMKSKTLDVYYDQDGTPGDAKAAQPGPAGQQQIRRLEAKGGVIVTQKDQTATGETGVFDMQANTVTLIGSVVITQGQQVIKGDRLTVDLTTGVSHVEGSVQGLLFPNSRPKTGDKTGDGKAGDGKAADTKATDTRAADTKAADTKAADTKAADTRDTRTETSRGREAPKPSAKSTSGQPLKLN